MRAGEARAKYLGNVLSEKYQLSRLQVQETVEIVGYAAELASSLVKESIEESGREEGQWSIPCSKDCHSDRHETGGQCAGSGQLCWTPESTVSLDTMDTAQSREVGLCKTGEESENNVMLRKGASVPNVSRDEQEDPDCQHSKSHKRSFLRTLGLGGKTGSEANARPSHKMRSLRKTLSSLFRRSAEDSGSRGKTAAVPPGQRALPPVPARQDSQTSQDTIQANQDNLELRDNPDGGEDLAEEHQQADNLMDFAASIEKVKDVS